MGGPEFQAWLVPVGLAVVLLALSDLVVTTLTVRGGGPLSARFAASVWRLLLALHRRWSLHHLLSYAGMVILIGTMLLWIGLLWLGWAIAFTADASSIVVARNGEPSSTVEKVYFVGYTLFTLGLGDFRPLGEGWMILTVLVVATGLLTVTLIITYALQVVSAAAVKRQVAASIVCLGRTPEEVLCRAWTGKDFAGLDKQLTALTGPLVEVSQQYLMFPVLPYFHGRQPQISMGLAVAVLDEAMLLLAHRVAPQTRPPPAVLRPLRTAVGLLLDTLAAAHITPADRAPPPPDTGRLRRAGLPLSPDDAFADAMTGDERRRRLLLAFVESDGWSWDDVHGGVEKS